MTYRDRRTGRFVSAATYRRSRSRGGKRYVQVRKKIRPKHKPTPQPERDQAQMILSFIDRADIPDRRRAAVDSLVRNNFGKRGFKFEFEGEGVLKISISTRKTRKKFSVRA